MQAIIIEIFKTDVQDLKSAENILLKLSDLFPNAQFNFDLDDCDKILRVEGHDFNLDKIKETLNLLGHGCDLIVE